MYTQEQKFIHMVENERETHHHKTKIRKYIHTNIVRISVANLIYTVVGRLIYLITTCIIYVRLKYFV